MRYKLDEPVKAVSEDSCVEADVHEEEDRLYVPAVPLMELFPTMVQETPLMSYPVWVFITSEPVLAKICPIVIDGVVLLDEVFPTMTSVLLFGTDIVQDEPTLKERFDT